MQQPLGLALGDINIVAVTDVHSWVAGHGKHEPSLNADYGDVLSFYQELQQLAAAVGRDVFLVMNGDMCDGTGLSAVPPAHLTPLLQQMPFDAINFGNHEGYHNQTVAFLKKSGFIDHWQGNYLTSNTYWAGGTKHPVGHAYTYLHGKHSQSRILTFGFLYNFQNHCEMITVQKVQETVKMEWFQKVLLEGTFDAILVLAHMDYVDPLVSLLHTSIRALVGSEMPIQFINGHSHRRGFHVYDQTSTAFEAGRFLDTVGFVSFPTLASVQTSDDPASLFRHVFLNASREVLALAVGNDIKTADGEKLTDMIRKTQEDMGLEEIIGCSANSYFPELHFENPHSLYRLYMHEVLPYNLGHNASKIFLSGANALRYALFQGQISVDDLIAVDPFEDMLFLAATAVKGSEILTGFQNWRSEPEIAFHWSGTSDIDPQRIYDLYAQDFELDAIRNRLQAITERKLEPAMKWKRPNGSPMTTNIVWHDFVKQNWPCTTAFSVSRHRRTTLDEHKNTMFLGYMFWGLAMICFAFITVLSKAIKRQEVKEKSPIDQYEFRGYGSVTPSRFRT